MRETIKKLISWTVGLFKKKPLPYSQIPQELQGPHDCALRALYVSLPKVSVKEMVAAFDYCCEWWPHKGVDNKEFNIALDYLKIKDKFNYVADESTTLGCLLGRKKEIFIALIYGHYTVINNGFILDYFNHPATCKVYCYWKLK